jgi:hypothetical protein
MSQSSFGPQNQFFSCTVSKFIVTAAYKIANISLVQFKINLAEHLFVCILHSQYQISIE